MTVRSLTHPANGETASSGLVSELAVDSDRYRRLREDLVQLLRDEGIPATLDATDEDLVAVIKTMMKQRV